MTVLQLLAGIDLKIRIAGGCDSVGLGGHADLTVDDNPEVLGVGVGPSSVGH